MSVIEFWRHGDWTMVYKDGRLEQAGDHYLADEWLQSLCNVVVVDDEAGDCMDSDGAARATKREVDHAQEARLARLTEASEMRLLASELIKKAERLEASK